MQVIRSFAWAQARCNYIRSLDTKDAKEWLRKIHTFTTLGSFFLSLPVARVARTNYVLTIGAHIVYLILYVATSKCIGKKYQKSRSNYWNININCFIVDFMLPKQCFLTCNYYRKINKSLDYFIKLVSEHESMFFTSQNSPIPSKLLFWCFGRHLRKHERHPFARILSCRSIKRLEIDLSRQ